MRKLKLFLDAKAANTPPRGISKASRVIFSVLTLLLLSIGQVWATDFTLSSAAAVTNDGISVSFAKGSGSTAPTWYSAGLRLYASNTITISCDNDITGVTFNWEKQGSKAFASVTASPDSYSHPTAAGEGTWSGSAKSITFTLGSSGQLQLNTFSVTTASGGTPTCATPTFDPEDGEKFDESIDVEINAEDGATIYYTTDGNAPTTSSSVYSTALHFTETTTLKAMAVKAGSNNSAVATATYKKMVTVPGYAIDFESELDAYVDWEFSNIGIRTSTITAHGGTYYGSNVNGNGNATTTAAIKTKAKVATPGVLTFYISKESNNTTASSWKAQVSADGSEWTEVETFDAKSMSKGAWNECTADLSEYSNVYVRIYYEGSNAIRAIDDIELAEAAAVAKPAISGDENFVTSTTVTISHADADHIYYTTNGDAPTTSSTLYSAPFEVNATTTIKAIAVKGSDESTVAEKTFTKQTVLTVAEALVEATGSDKYVTGTITSITEVNIGFKNATYVISDISAGVKQNEMIVYRGKYIGGADFTSADQIHVGDVVLVSGSLTQYNQKNQMAQGNQIETISAAAVAAPEFTPNGGGFMGETDVTITCATDGATIYYTLDGTNPTNLSTLYEGAIHLNATTTITAIAYVGEESSLVVAKEFTLTAPMTVAEAYDALTGDDINNAAVAGIVYQVDNISNEHATYWISDNGEAGEKVLEVYNGYGLNGASITAGGIQVGDEVTVFGNLTIYVKNATSTKEFAAGSRLLAFNRPVVAVSSVTMTESTAEVEVGSTVTLHASVLPENATNKGINWTVQSGSDKASVADGVVTGIEEGTAVIRAASAADATKYAECTVTVNAADPTKHVVTFDAKVDKGESPLSKSNITFTCSNGVLNNESEYRLYKSSTTTFACSVGNITKIEFTGVSGNPVSGFGDPEEGTLVTDGNDGVWTGNAASVSFVASGAQVRATEIKVTYKEDNRSTAGLAWNTDAVELTVGDEFTAPTLNNPNNIDAAEISIESSNTSLATVTAGVVALVADATGTATITATFAGNDDYKPATISYNITVNEAGLDNVTFDSSEDHAESGETTITKGGFTLSFTSGSMDGTQAEYRLYKGQTMTLSSTDYKIKKIEFTCTSGNSITGFADATGLDKDNNEWTGESNTVELTASNAQVRMTKIKVFYVEDTRAAAGLAWDPADDIELTVGDALSAPTLLNPNSIDAAEITIESSNTDIATVTAGEVALVADATGTTTITATFAGNDDFKPATVSYKIKVNPAYAIYVSPSLNVNFGSVEQDAEVADKKVTVTFTNVPAATLTLEGAGASAFTISPAAAMTESGDITISASSANLGTFAATLTISDDANNAESKVVNLSITVNEVVTPETPVSTTSQWVPATEIVDGMQVLIVGVNNTDYSAMGVQNNNNRAAVAASVDGEGVLTPGENTMAFTVVEQSDGKFALRTSNGKYLYAASSSSNYLRSQDELDDNGRWTLTVTSAVANGTYTHKMMQFNSSSSIFACYTTSTTTQKPIALYVPKQDTPEPPVVDYTEVRNGLTEGWYYTICLDKAVTAVQGGSIWRVLSKAANGTDVILEEVLGTLDAGRPYIFRAAASTLEVAYTGDAVGAPVNDEDNNGLVGSFTEEPLVQNPNHYIIYNNALYYVNSDNVKVGAHRAYLDMTGVPAYNNEPQQGAPRRRVTMEVHGEQVATGIDAINASEKPMKLMIDGQIYILRGEKMYDATGRLVK